MCNNILPSFLYLRSVTISVLPHPILPSCYTCYLLPFCYQTSVTVSLSIWWSLWHWLSCHKKDIRFFQSRSKFYIPVSFYERTEIRGTAQRFPTSVLVPNPKRQLLPWKVGWRRRAVGQVKWQARGLAAHNGEGDHRSWVGVHSGIVVCDSICDTRLPQTEVMAPARSLFGTSEPSLFSWRFVHWGRSCCHYSEHKRNTWIF